MEPGLSTGILHTQVKAHHCQNNLFWKGPLMVTQFLPCWIHFQSISGIWNGADGRSSFFHFCSRRFNKKSTKFVLIIEPGPSKQQCMPSTSGYFLSRRHQPKPVLAWNSPSDIHRFDGLGPFFHLLVLIILFLGINKNCLQLSSEFLLSQDFHNYYSLDIFNVSASKQITQSSFLRPDHSQVERN